MAADALRVCNVVTPHRLIARTGYKQCVTLGPDDILKAKEIFLLAAARNKAELIQYCFVHHLRHSLSLSLTSPLSHIISSFSEPFRVLLSSSSCFVHHITCVLRSYGL